jgi:hypothetical protein
MAGMVQDAALVDEILLAERLGDLVATLLEVRRHPEVCDHPIDRLIR